MAPGARKDLEYEYFNWSMSLFVSVDLLTKYINGSIYTLWCSSCCRALLIEIILVRCIIGIYCRCVIVFEHKSRAIIYFEFRIFWCNLQMQLSCANGCRNTLHCTRKWAAQSNCMLQLEISPPLPPFFLHRPSLDETARIPYTLPVAASEIQAAPSLLSAMLQVPKYTASIACMCSFSATKAARSVKSYMSRRVVLHDLFRNSLASNIHVRTPWPPRHHNKHTSWTGEKSILANITAKLSGKHWEQALQSILINWKQLASEHIHTD